MRGKYPPLSNYETQGDLRKKGWERGEGGENMRDKNMVKEKQNQTKNG